MPFSCERFLRWNPRSQKWQFSKQKAYGPLFLFAITAISMVAAARAGSTKTFSRSPSSGWAFDPGSPLLPAGLTTPKSSATTEVPSWTPSSPSPAPRHSSTATISSITTTPRTYAAITNTKKGTKRTKQKSEGFLKKAAAGKPKPPKKFPGKMGKKHSSLKKGHHYKKPPVKHLRTKTNKRKPPPAATKFPAITTTAAKSNVTTSLSDVTTPNKPPAGLLAKGSYYISNKKQLVKPVIPNVDSKKVQNGDNNKRLVNDRNRNGASAVPMLGADEDIGYEYADYGAGSSSEGGVGDYVDEMVDDVMPEFMNPQFHSLAKGNLSQMAFKAMDAAIYGDALLKSQMNALEAYSVEDSLGGLIVFFDKEAFQKEMLEDHPRRPAKGSPSSSSKKPSKNGNSQGGPANSQEGSEKVPQQQPILEKRNLVQFARIVKVYNTVSPLYFIFYGNWCGPLGDGPAADGIDQCCKIHDHCYGDVMYDACPPGWRNPYTVVYNWKIAQDKRGGKRAVCLPGDACGRETCLCDQRAAECFGRNVFNRRHVGQRLLG